MRLIHIVPAVSEEASGPSYAVKRLCQALTDLGEEVTLAALDWAPMKVRPDFLKLFPVGLGPRRLGRSPTMYRWLSAEVDSGSVDVVHNHGMWQMNSLYPSWSVRRRLSTLVVSPHGSLSAWAMSHGSALKRVVWPLLQRPALGSAACFHATAESEYGEVRQLGFTQPVTIVPLGVDIPETGQPPNGKLRTLLFLGRIHPVKGLDTLLYAWGAVLDRFPDWRLRVVGDDAIYGPSRGYLQKIRELAEALQLKRVDFSGPLYGDAKWSAYRAADLLVLPTHSENFGMAVAESLAAGTPVIVTRGAPWEGLVTQDAGWWIDLGLDSLVAALEEAMSHSRQDLQAFGAKGREWMKREYSWPVAARRMRRTYEWLMGGGGRPAWVRN
jgi:glycosyltransferase involved in cell wall biosynthesis